MFCDFQTTTYGKWILAGEHAVLRGHGALVFPIKEKHLTLTYEPSFKALKAEFTGDCGDAMHLLFWSVLEQGQHLLGHSLNELTGYFLIESNIPIGAGMGASAALCVAMARWFDAQQLLQKQTIANFAKQLENLFHGQSSGLDIAGVSSKQGIYFKQGESVNLKPAWQPHWYLSSSGQIGITSHCIQLVQQLWQSNPSIAKKTDDLMANSVDKSRQALENDHSSSRQQLIQAINESAACFETWGLVSQTLSSHMQALRELGALAVKPTGSGGGGYVLSVWEKKPTLPFECIEL